jgi:hypothetical protein
MVAEPTDARARGSGVRRNAGLTEDAEQWGDDALADLQDRCPRVIVEPVAAASRR